MSSALLAQAETRRLDTNSNVSNVDTNAGTSPSVSPLPEARRYNPANGTNGEFAAATTRAVPNQMLERGTRAPNNDFNSSSPNSPEALLAQIGANRGFPIEQSMPRVRSYLIAEWRGQVLSIEDNYFVAELKGTIGNGVAGSHEEATIPIEDMSPPDLELLQVGAFFRLCVSYEVSLHGTRRRYTGVVFRRMPAYRRDELEQADREAADLVRAIRVE